MEYIEYNNQYEKDVKLLIKELQEYIISIDKDNLNIITDSYIDLALTNTIEEIKNNQGKMILAIKDKNCIGFIVGIITRYDELDKESYKCPIKGEITELIVTKKVEAQGVGTKLVELMEIYLKEQNCQYIALDVFSYNEHAINFYKKKGYHNRLITMLKKV